MRGSAPLASAAPTPTSLSKNPRKGPLLQILPGRPNQRPAPALVFSAKQPAALKGISPARRAARCLRTDPAPALADVCFTTNAWPGRTSTTAWPSWPQRAADAAAALAAHAGEAGPRSDGRTSRVVIGRGPSFCSPGRGRRIPVSGRELFETHLGPTFRCGSGPACGDPGTPGRLVPLVEVRCMTSPEERKVPRPDDVRPAGSVRARLCTRARRMAELGH